MSLPLHWRLLVTALLLSALGLSACAGEEAAPVGAVPTDTPPPTATVSQPPTLIPTFEPDQPGGKADVSSEQATIAPTIPEAEVTMVPSLEQLIKPHFFARSATSNTFLGKRLAGSSPRSSPTVPFWCSCRRLRRNGRATGRRSPAPPISM